MKYKYNGQWVDLSIKALDSMPVGTIVEYDGQTSDIPSGWQSVTGGKIKKITETTPTMASIVNGYSTSTQDGYSCEYINGIIESGSNSNGNWVKYADGTMICYKTVQSDVDMTTEWGSGIYEGSQVLGNYAQEFSETPCVSITNSSVNGGIVECFLVAPNKTSAGTVTYCRVGGASRSIKTNIMAIGKWK